MNFSCRYIIHTPVGFFFRAGTFRFQVDGFRRLEGKSQQQTAMKQGMFQNLAHGISGGAVVPKHPRNTLEKGWVPFCLSSKKVRMSPLRSGFEGLKRNHVSTIF